MRILAISGSLRAQSTNTSLLRAAAVIAPSSIEVVLYEEMETFPPFNPDLDIEPGPEGVWSFRAALQDASAVIFSTPEYAHGIPGSLKNALDWVVGSGELSGKPVALMNASARGEYAQAALREVLKTMDARLVSDAEITVPLLGKGLGASEIAADAEFAALIRSSLQTIAAVSRGSNREEQEQMQGQRQKQIPAG
jgi:chromate reductase, NAD(P)H dehydrogenase (quinone)